MHAGESSLYLRAQALLHFHSHFDKALYIPPPSAVIQESHATFAVRGNLRMPPGIKVRTFPFRVQLGDLNMELLALGPRKARQRRFRSSTFEVPAYMDSCPLEAAHALGGKFHSLAFVPNPIGKGFAVRGYGDCLSGVDLPRLENPNNRLSSSQWPLRKWSHWPKWPPPWIPDGAYGEGHPLRKQDVFAEGESLILENCLPFDPLFRWQLPRWNPIAALSENGHGRTSPLKLRRVDIHLDSGTATLDYWTSFPIPGREYLASLTELHGGVQP